MFTTARPRQLRWPVYPMALGFGKAYLSVVPRQPAPTDLGNICEHPIDPGDCTGVFHRFAFDSATGDCRPFTYSGCGGNGNNFGSALECRNKCIKQKMMLGADVCQHPIEIGECSGVFPRFAFDLSSNECRSFTYGGCGGNGNNFGTLAECRTTCVRAQPPAVAQCPPVDVSQCVEPCVVFSNRRGCQECVCPLARPESENVLSGPPKEEHESDVSESHPPADTAPGGAHAAGENQPQRNVVETESDSFSSADAFSRVNSVTELGEKCAQPVDAGPCKNFIERWFFDVSSGLCQPFRYGGCAGNRNHFFSKHECEIHCARFLSKLKAITQ
ncbi:unnamed protein product [Gongylonema pulchrum]|uniref:Kunitz/Bovine pancreatic trypsin inhibitor domain protein n=1 Tax=Gongylonema pulchrum TaxID=637853 RepID=A0A183DZP7_9BILA|nr:unnamed protein product [Gongylonema pulchrum]